MRKKIFVVFVAFLAVTGGLLFFARKTTHGPALAWRPEIDLGQLEADRVHSVPIVIRNEGETSLILSKVTPSCGCMKVEVDGGPRVAPTDSLAVPANSALTLLVEVRVQGQTPIDRAEQIRFATNDDEHPTGSVILRFSVRGRLVPSEWSIQVPAMRTGELRKGTLHLYDTTRDRSLRVGKIESSDVNSVRLLEINRDPAAPMPGGPVQDAPDRRLAASLDYEIRPRGVAGSYREQLTVFEDGAVTPCFSVPISWTVRDLYEFSPPEISLPINTSDGPIFSGRAICRCADETRFRLEVVDPPGGWDVAVSGGNGLVSGPRIVTIRGVPPLPCESESTKVTTIKFRVLSEGAATVVSLPVLCSRLR